MQGAKVLEAEMRKLKLELKHTMEMYSTACKEAITAKQKVIFYFFLYKNGESRDKNEIFPLKFSDLNYIVRPRSCTSGRWRNPGEWRWRSTRKKQPWR